MRYLIYQSLFWIKRISSSAVEFVAIIPKWITMHFFSLTLSTRKIIVTERFEGFLPKPSSFEITTETYYPPSKGDFIVLAKYISVDPYMRSFANYLDIPYEQFGFQIGLVLESKSTRYPEGSYVVAHGAWKEISIFNENPDPIFHMRPYIPDLSNLPLSYFLGVLGMPGMAAYLGLMDICKPKTGEIVCVSSAAGAVGSLVGQIAKIQGCVVIGIAGSEAKINCLINELGFHYAINYKTEPDLKAKLNTIAPDGIDCYFDNVGGDLSAAVIDNMKEKGRVAVCGSISTYGSNNVDKQEVFMSESLHVESFSFTRWSLKERNAAVRQLKTWIEENKIVVKETIVQGFMELPNALISMLRGDHIGKTVVKCGSYLQRH